MRPSPLQLLDEFPDHRSGLEALAAFIEATPTPPSPAQAAELSPDTLRTLLQPRTPEEFAGILARLVRNGVLARSIKVKAVAPAADLEVTSLLDVPTVRPGSPDGQPVPTLIADMQLVFRLPRTLPPPN